MKYKKDAPIFANIFMVNLEDELLHKAKCKPLVMFRFINHIFSSGPIQKSADRVHQSI